MTKKVDWGWVSRELGFAKADNPIKEAVVGVIRSLREHDLTDEQELDVAKKLIELIQGHSIAIVEPEERWITLRPGEYQIGDTIRVKTNAYEGDRGRNNNGKLGRVVATRNGNAVVLYNDAPSTEYLVQHKPENLQKRVR